MTPRIKRFLLCSAAGLLFYSGLLSFRQFFRKRLLGKKEICVLGLHRVLSEAERERASSLGGIILRESTFAALLGFLHRRFAVISLDGFLKALREGPSGSRPWCLLTFDDGWRDNFTTALPWLRKHQMPAVVFVTTGFIGKHETFWVERLREAWRDPEARNHIRSALGGGGTPASGRPGFEEVVEHLKHMPMAQRDGFLAQPLSSMSAGTANDGDEMLSWEEAALLQQSGVEIEAHTVNHPLLTYEDESTVKQELADARQAIEENLHKKARAFAYPNGSWNQKVRDWAESAGYECAFTTARGWHASGDDPFTIRRVMVHEGKLLGLNGKFSPAVAALRLTGWI